MPASGTYSMENPSGGPASLYWGQYVDWLAQRGLNPNTPGVLSYKNFVGTEIGNETARRASIDRLRQQQGLPPQIGSGLRGDSGTTPPGGLLTLPDGGYTGSGPAAPGSTGGSSGIPGMGNVGLPENNIPAPTGPGVSIPGGEYNPNLPPYQPGQQMPGLPENNIPAPTGPGTSVPGEPYNPSLPPNTGYQPGPGPQANPLASYGYTIGPNGEVMPLMLSQGMSPFQNPIGAGNVTGLLGMPQSTTPKGGLLGGG